MRCKPQLLLPAIFAAMWVLAAAALMQAQSTGENEQRAGLAHQAATSSTRESEFPTIRTSVNEVQLSFTAKRKGRLVRDLEQQELEVADEGQPPARVGSFWKAQDSTLQTAFVVDVSGSVQFVFKNEKRSAMQFLEKVLHKGDRAAVFSFSDKVGVAQDFTDDQDQLANAIQQLKATRGSTAIFDAVRFASVRLLSIGAPSPSARRAIVLITDGDDNASKSSLADAVRDAQSADVVVYAVQVNADEFDRKSQARKNLKELCNQTGGRLYETDGSQRIAPAFHSIAEELHSQYIVAYTPAGWEANGKFRTVKLRVRRHGVTVHCRAGYYAERTIFPNQDF